jgi:ADP-ribose pyrophosphatase YjhB (NUDIX family)
MGKMNPNKKSVSPFSDIKAGSAGSADSTRAANSGRPENSGVRVESGESVETEPVRSPEPARSVEPAELAETAEPAEAAESAQAAEPLWVGWARELQAIAQTGLHFSESEYDQERYRRILEISVEIFSRHSDASPGFIHGLFENQSGYATPKVDVRGVVFRHNRLLLVQERSDGLWTLPGGWADVNDSPAEAVEREIVEESGFRTKAEKMLAVFDRAKHSHEPPFPFHVYKLFILCRLEGGEARTTWETTGVEFFDENELPPLSISRVTGDQIKFCFEVKKNPATPCRFD